jgi:cell division septal protein FtsQ
LPRVQGLSRATPPATPGTRNTSEPVRAALRVLEALRAAQPRLPRRIATVDVGDPRQIRLVTEDEVEIRCGAPEDLPGQLAQLRAVLRALERRETAARYIDLRFGEPVVAPRT